MRAWARVLLVGGVVGLVATAAPARAAPSDRSQPMVVEADRPGTVDLQRQVAVFNGNVVVTQGSLVLRADRIETREQPDGYRMATAIGSASQPATWHQQGANRGEVVEGQAERIDYDGRADTLRLTGGSRVRRLRDGVVTDEVTGGIIVWDNTTQTARVEGGAVTATNPSGRVRAVLSPRAAQASPASAPAGTGALVPSDALAPPR
ncbi:MAG: lipopolysaccharide transport periplasmic protein LptA [Burkholderiales bacterium]|nr:lipopolysaccharide transport periplasmic protein LptA [Burkholderiales bacterium]MDE2275726.1 lipopolysaccharide transport periplasmic protein LptA [Burkholderiales bacterium]